jgi:hypothetical protein
MSDCLPQPETSNPPVTTIPAATRRLLKVRREWREDGCTNTETKS